MAKTTSPHDACAESGPAPHRTLLIARVPEAQALLPLAIPSRWLRESEVLLLAPPGCDPGSGQALHCAQYDIFEPGLRQSDQQTFGGRAGTDKSRLLAIRFNVQVNLMRIWWAARQAFASYLTTGHRGG